MSLTAEETQRITTILNYTYNKSSFVEILIASKRHLILIKLTP
jgi:hypothetical protein